jgi:hypothetical protein
MRAINTDIRRQYSIYKRLSHISFISLQGTKYILNRYHSLTIDINTTKLHCIYWRRTDENELFEIEEKLHQNTIYCLVSHGKCIKNHPFKTDGYQITFIHWQLTEHVSKQHFIHWLLTERVSKQHFIHWRLTEQVSKQHFINWRKT